MRTSSIVCGAPRKPHQSGRSSGDRANARANVAWTMPSGLSPPQTALTELVRHFCNEIRALESLFLIPKSSCALEDFKGDMACVGHKLRLMLRESVLPSCPRFQKSVRQRSHTNYSCSTGPSVSPSTISLVEDNLFR